MEERIKLEEKRCDYLYEKTQKKIAAAEKKKLKLEEQAKLTTEQRAQQKILEWDREALKEAKILDEKRKK